MLRKISNDSRIYVYTIKMNEQRPSHILVVDDDRDIRDLLDRFLTKHGFRVSTARDGLSLRKALVNVAIDLIVLDVMLPGESGLSLCKTIRSESTTPIIMLTAMGDDSDRIIGLEVGADDYLPKPFNPRELLARINAVLRRFHSKQETSYLTGDTLKFDNWILNKGTRTLKNPKGIEIELTTGEYDLLLALVSHPRRILTRDYLLDLYRGRNANPFDRKIDIQIMRLRRKIEDNPKQPRLIKTVRGGGYMFSSEVKGD